MKLLGGSTVGMSVSTNLTDFSGEYYSDFSTFGSASTDTPAVANVTGGVAPFTYSWSRVSGSTSIYAGTPTGQSTYFVSTFFASGNRSAVFNCTVTDAAATVVASNNVNVFIEYF